MPYTLKTVLYALLPLSPVATNRIRPRVVGGVPDDGHQFPFTVMLEGNKPPLTSIRTCSGSLIALTWVLTAGHCIPQNHEMLRVKYGDAPMSKSAFARTKKAIIHPSFRMNNKTAKNDIGLLKIEKVSNAIAKLSAVEYTAFMGMPVKYGGFGRSRLLFKGENPRQWKVLDDLNPPLLVGEGVVISCKQDGGLSFGSPAICIAPRCGPLQRPYFGDSGGPLIYNGRIIGVLSGYAYPELPMVGYTPVSPYLEWIHDTMQSDKDFIIVLE